MGKLTAATVRIASRPGLHGDGATLIQWVTVGGRRRAIGLGGYSAVSFAKARHGRPYRAIAVRHPGVGIHELCLLRPHRSSTGLPVSQSVGMAPDHVTIRRRQHGAE